MKADTIMCEVVVKMIISDETADMCLRLLEMWQNDHPDQWIMASKNDDGTVKLYREKRP